MALKMTNVLVFIASMAVQVLSNNGYFGKETTEEV
jgi:hypothetical protein